MLVKHLRTGKKREVNKLQSIGLLASGEYVEIKEDPSGSSCSKEVKTKRG